MLKLTKASIKEILAKKITLCSKEELSAIFKLIGLQVKEYRIVNEKSGEGLQCSFEMHYKREYVIEVSVSSGSKVVSFSNYWVNFGDGSDGAAIPIKNVRELMLVMINLWLQKLCHSYDGPEYNERQDYEYSSLGEMSQLLKYLQKLLTEKEEEVVIAKQGRVGKGKVK